jgi:hypothetical protein
MDFVLEPIAIEFGCNLVIGAGETSEVRCRDLIERAQRIGRPVRVLYISDFDPGGQSMPLAAARKIEFLGRDKDLDIQVVSVALTHEQCIEYRLPRTPMKETERRAARFEQRFGEGATELDALEELHPGVLRQLIVNEIDRYHDPDLDDAVSDANDEFEARRDEVREAARDQRAEDLRALEDAYDALAREINDDLRGIKEKYADRHAALAARFNELQQEIETEMRDQAPDPNEIELPEPADGDENPDPPFDSTRSYLDQIERYKAHQGKPTTRRPWGTRTRAMRVRP